MIELHDVKPIPLIEDGLDLQSQTWGKDIQFSKPKKYLVTAPSGKGKSTLVHMIYGLRNDYKGQIQFEGRDISKFSHDEWADFRQNKCAIVFQNLRLFPNLSALENIMLKNNLSNHKQVDEIKAMAAKLGVGALLSRPCGQLSYGQRQRIAIIRAICQPFDFLLLDEPFSHLDNANIKIATELISKELEVNNAAMLLVSLGEKYYFKYDEEILL